MLESLKKKGHSKEIIMHYPRETDLNHIAVEMTLYDPQTLGSLLIAAPPEQDPHHGK